jgi:hypothetical protein
MQSHLVFKFKQWKDWSDVLSKEKLIWIITMIIAFLH